MYFTNTHIMTNTKTFYCLVISTFAHVTKNHERMLHEQKHFKIKLKYNTKKAHII